MLKNPILKIILWQKKKYSFVIIATDKVIHLMKVQVFHTNRDGELLQVLSLKPLLNTNMKPF